MNLEEEKARIRLLERAVDKAMQLISTEDDKWDNDCEILARKVEAARNGDIKVWEE